MSEGTLELLSIKELIRAARRYPLASRTDIHMSLPLPMRQTTGLAVMFLYCQSVTSVQFGLQLMPPQRAALLDASTGQVENEKEVTPKDFQQPHAIHQVIGTYEIPSHLSRQQFIELREALYRVYDLTMPAFRSGPRDALPEVRDAARSFLQLFPQVAEQPLLLYYQAAGREFFAWLRAIISA